MAKRDKRELTPTEKRALQMMTPEGRAELYGGGQTTQQTPEPVAQPLVPNSPMQDDETLLGQSMEASNRAQQEPARQDSMMRDAEREINYGSSSPYQGSPEYEARYAESSDPIENLNSLADTVGQERQDAIFNPPNLLPSGRAEFDAASRGEIPGYAIKDPGARAAFANARMQDPKFGSQERARANRLNDPAGPDIPFDQELLDRIGNDIDVSNEKLRDRRIGVYNGITDPVEMATQRVYEKAKASESGRKLIGNTYEGMGKQAQKRQQPRSAGGMGQGPLTNRRSKEEEQRLSATFQEREEKFRDAIENADVDAEFIEIDGKKYTWDKATEIYGNLQDRNSRPSGSRLRGEVVSDPASRGRGGRPYRMQTGHVGSARGGGPITQRRVKPGEAGYGGNSGYGATMASGGESVTGGQTPASMMQFVDDTGNTFTTPGGGSFPNPYSSSSADYGQILADNPQAGDDIAAAAEELGLLTDAQRQEIERLGGPLPRNISPRQRSQYQSQRDKKSGELFHGIAHRVAKETERVNAANIRRDATTSRQETSRADSEYRQLEYIHRQYIDPSTKGKTKGSFTFGIQGFDEGVKVPDRTMLTDEEIQAARKFRDKMRMSVSQGQARASQNVAVATDPAQKTEPNAIAGPAWSFNSREGFDPSIFTVGGGTSNVTGVEYPIVFDEVLDHVYLRAPLDMTAEQFVGSLPQELLATIHGIAVPVSPGAMDKAQQFEWTNPDTVSGVSSKKIPLDELGALQATEGDELPNPFGN